MNNTVFFFLHTLADIDQHWGVQRIPAASPLGPTGYVVNIGFKHFWAASLEDALSQALSWREEQQNAALPGQ